MAAVARIINVRPDQRRNVAVSFLLLFGIMASYALLETARDALFLSSLPAARLPWAYLAMAVVVTLVSWLSPREGAGRLGRRRLTLGLLGAAALMPVLALVAARSREGAYAFYVGVGVVATGIIVRAWVLIGGLFTIEGARREFARIATGGLVGAISGAALATQIMQRRGPLALVPVAALLLALTALLPLGIQMAPRPVLRPVVEDEPEERASLDRVYRSAYARQLFWMVVLGTIATTLADFVFKSMVAADTARRDLGPFFARYQLVLNIVALVVQTQVAPLLLRRIGANRAVLVLPALATLTAAGFAVLPGLWTALATRGVDGALRNSLYRTSAEVLYVPLPGDVRARLKTFIDGVGQRGGQAVASLAALVLHGVGARSGHLALLLFVATGAWLVAALGLRQHYVAIFRGQLRAGKIDERAPLPQLDLESVESLLTALNSSDDARVIAALDALHEHDKDELIPALILYHPSPQVALHALELLDGAGRSDFLPLTDQLLRHADPELRAAALRSRAAAGAGIPELRRFAADRNAAVRATALVALVRLGGGTRAREWPALERVVASGVDDARQALLQAMARLPDESFVPLVNRLAQSDGPEQKLQAARAMAAYPDARYLPTALAILEVRAAREAARRVFLAAGSAGLDFLAEAEGDPAIDLKIRRHIPRTISRFGNERAAAILLDGLGSGEPDGVIRYKMLRGLGRMRTNDPGLRLDQTRLLRGARASIARSAELLEWRLALEGAAQSSPERTPTHALLVDLLGRKERMATERLFRYLDLLHPGEELKRIYDGLESHDPARRASSRELLEYLLEPELRPPVLALTAPVTDAERLAALTTGPRSPLPHHPLPDRRATVAALVDDHSQPLAALASEYHNEMAALEERHAS